MDAIEKISKTVEDEAEVKTPEITNDQIFAKLDEIYKMLIDRADKVEDVEEKEITKETVEKETDETKGE